MFGTYFSYREPFIKGRAKVLTFHVQISRDEWYINNSDLLADTRKSLLLVTWYLKSQLRLVHTSQVAWMQVAWIPASQIQAYVHI
jgi:hypothetical protein